jgi:hypothetical protein
MLARSIVVIAVLIAAAGAEAQCRAICMPDETRDASGCCVLPTSPPTLRAPQLAPCPPGQTRSETTAGQCCFSGQVWAEERCRGIPSSCPPRTRIEGETCRPLDCEEGTVRASDGVTCCYSGQVAVAGVCRGVPTSCPAEHRVEGEGCQAIPRTGVLDVMTSEPDVRVFIDRQPASRGENEVPAGTRFVRVVAPGRRPFTARVEVEWNGRARLEVPVMRRAGRELRIEHAGEGAPIDVTARAEGQTLARCVAITTESPCTLEGLPRTRVRLVASESAFVLGARGDRVVRVSNEPEMARLIFLAVGLGLAGVGIPTLAIGATDGFANRAENEAGVLGGVLFMLSGGILAGLSFIFPESTVRFEDITGQAERSR